MQRNVALALAACLLASLVGRMAVAQDPQAQQKPSGKQSEKQSATHAEAAQKVGQANAASSVQTMSSDFTANYTDPELLKKLQGYIAAVQAPVAGGKQVVGAIVAVNGKIEAVDVFQSTPLFKKLWPKLLKGDALDALDAASGPDAAKQATVNDAREFLRTAMQAAVAKKTNNPGGLVVTKRDSEHVMSFSAGMGGMGGGAFGGAPGSFGDADAVHSSAYKK